MTLKEAAALLGVTPATLRQQIANGKLRATKRGRDWWVTKGDVHWYQVHRLGTRRTILVETPVDDERLTDAPDSSVWEGLAVTRGRRA